MGISGHFSSMACPVMANVAPPGLRDSLRSEAGGTLDILDSFTVFMKE